MSMPSPFELGRSIGTNVSSGISQFTEGGTIERILNQASQSEDPQDIDNLMGEILKRVSPKNQKAASDLLQNQKNEIISKNQLLERENSFEDLGFDRSIARLSEGVQKDFLKDSLKNKQLMNYGLDLVKRQFEILDRGNLGPAIGIGGTGRKFVSTWTKQGRIDRAEYTQIGKALISFASKIPIRNRSEFETLSHALINPSLTQEEIRGTLNAIQLVISEGTQGGGDVEKIGTERLSLEEVFK